MLLGTLLAILSIRFLVPSNANLPLWIFAYPIVDVSLVVATRKWLGRPLGGADRSHLHHWMMDRLNHKVWLATPILWVLAALPMLHATKMPGAGALSLIGGCALPLLGAKVFFDRIRHHKRSEDKRFTYVGRRSTRFVTDAERRVASSSQHAS
jgi:membrane protein implicated in regulation of membrane protease activity